MRVSELLSSFFINAVADWLANLAVRKKSGFFVFSEPPKAEEFAFW